MAFVAYGDLPYKNIDYSLYESLIKNINATEPSLVIHIGDAHAEDSCSDKNIDSYAQLYERFCCACALHTGR